MAVPLLGGARGGFRAQIANAFRPWRLPLNLRFVADDVRRRIGLESKTLRLLTSAATIQRRSADFPVCCIAGFPTCEVGKLANAPNWRRPAGWETGDTAGLETCATSAARPVSWFGFGRQDTQFIADNSPARMGWRFGLPAAFGAESWGVHPILVFQPACSLAAATCNCYHDRMI